MLDLLSNLLLLDEIVPYQSRGGRRKNVQIGVGWSLSGGSPPPPIPERVFDGIPGFFAWLALLFCIASAVAFPRTLLGFAAVVGLYSSLRFLMASLANSLGIKQIAEWEQRDYYAEYQQNADENGLAWEVVHHVVIIPAYKEPMPVLRRTLNNLKNQYEAKKRLSIVLAMEAAEVEAVGKAETLKAEYRNDFATIDYTVHPRGLPGEMQCKSANESWAARWIKRRLVDEMGYDINHMCVTTMDADTRWHPKYFLALTYLFAIDKDRYLRFWQGPIRYHGNIWDINPLMRIVNAYATAMELAYLAAPWWLAMPMSSYSLSLQLLDSCGYWDGDVIADEWHMFIKSYFLKDGMVKLVPIMLPFLADATLGESIFAALKLRYQQTLRHAWGSKEVGYMMAKMVEHPEVPFLRATRLLMRIAHDILLAGAGWIILTVGSQLPVLLHPKIAPVQLDAVFGSNNPLGTIATGFANDPIWLVIGLAGLLVVLLGGVFWYQDVQVRPPREGGMKRGERLLTALSFPLLPVLTLFVVALPTLEAQTRLLLGIPLQFRVTRKV